MGVVSEKKISVHGEKVNKMESKIKGGGPDDTEDLVFPNFPVRRLKNFRATIQSEARKQKRKSKAFI
jgi:hypothetical protein